MSIKFAPVFAGERSATEKLINKALVFFFEGGKDGGERHEINALMLAHSQTLRIGADKICQLDSPSHFSRSKWFPSPQSPWDRMDLPAPFTYDAKVENGANEIDLILHYGDNGNRHRIVVECKSGDAHSSGKQLNSYVQSMLEHDDDQQYFCYCLEGKAPDGCHHYLPYFHRIFAKIRNTQRRFNPDAVRFFEQYSYGQTGDPKRDLQPILRANGGEGVIGDEAAEVDELNRILQEHAGFRFHIFYAKASTPAKIATGIKKMIKRTHMPTPLPRGSGSTCTTSSTNELSP